MNWYYEKLGERHGPVSVQELVDALSSGEITVENLVWREGMANWTPLKNADALIDSDGDELALCAASGKVMKKSEMMPYGDKFVSPEHRETFVQGLMETGGSAGSESDGIIPTDFSVNIGDCFGRAWKTLSMDFWPIVGVSALIMIIVGAASQVGGGLVTIPIMAGLYYYLLRKVRGQSAEVGDAFYGFSNGFLKFFLMNLVLIGITTVVMIPFFVVMMIAASAGSAGAGDEALGIAAFIMIGISTLILIYIQCAWTMAPIICFDKDLPFWESMKISMKVFHKQFFWFILFFIVSGLVMMLGYLLLCVGIFIAAPWAMLAIIHLYEDIFGGKESTTQLQLER